MTDTVNSEAALYDGKKDTGYCHILGKVNSMISTIDRLNLEGVARQIAEELCIRKLGEAL